MGGGQSLGSGIPGFLVRDLGCEEFISKSGKVLDSSVITVHLPPEPKCGKDGALLVIIEPQNDSPAQHDPPVVSNTGSRTRESSEVSTSTVSPSDSASNIAWQWSHR